MYASYHNRPLLFEVCNIHIVACDTSGLCPVTVTSCTEHLITHAQAHGDGRAVQPLHALYGAEEFRPAIHPMKCLHTFKELYGYK